MPATPRRRSARLSGRTAASPRSAIHKGPQSSAQLGSLVERDETPNASEKVSSIDNVISTPTTIATPREKNGQVPTFKTPTTEPRPSHAEMHPKTVHQTTAKAPDSGLKLGFADPNLQRTFLAATPSKSERQSPPQNLTSPIFEFKFASESNLSSEAQKLMDNVREEAARIKAQMQVEKDTRDQKNDEAHDSYSGYNASGRKIARPKGKAGRFSDVHMAQFKKMDSIANHASAYRARPGFAQPTQQSLKRSGSKAGLDEPERPQTGGKGTPRKVLPSFSSVRPGVIPSKSNLSDNPISERLETDSPAKRMRHSEFHDVSAGRPQIDVSESSSTYSTIPRPGSNRLTSPTKASFARITTTRPVLASPDKPSNLPRSNSTKSLKLAFEVARLAESHKPTPSPSKVPRVDSTAILRPLPPTPGAISAVTAVSPLQHPLSTKTLPSSTPSRTLSSRLPTFAGLKSILRSNRPAPSKKLVDIAKAHTAEEPNAANTAIESAKKVDFTPSVKSRYAVKLAAYSPSPARYAQISISSTIPNDPAQSCLDNEEDDEQWEDAESEVEYPALPQLGVGPAPPTPVVHTFSAKSKEHNRRESKEFKSIFTTLHHPSRPTEPSTLTSVNTTVNKTNPMRHMGAIMRSPSRPILGSQSPSTIRRVRGSDANHEVQPFEDKIKTVPHGLPGKKRRRESVVENDETDADDDAKENRRISAQPQVPGGWEETLLEEDEGEKRGGKRMCIVATADPNLKKVEVRKPNAAREAAAKNAKERKGKGILSMARLNMLSRPKQRPQGL